MGDRVRFPVELRDISIKVMFLPSKQTKSGQYRYVSPKLYRTMDVRFPHKEEGIGSIPITATPD